MWGAEVFDVFGMSEAGLMGAENSAHDGIHIWTDMYVIEVVDPETGRTVPEGDVGTLCVTPLWTNHATPFLRWNSGDLVSFASRSAGTGPFAELFPVSGTPTAPPASSRCAASTSITRNLRI